MKRNIFMEIFEHHTPKVNSTEYKKPSSRMMSHMQINSQNFFFFLISQTL